jgi:hypothetical protein
MDSSSEIRVTLSDALLKHLRKEAEARHVPLQWLVAGLVCDTVENSRMTSTVRSIHGASH